MENPKPENVDDYIAGCSTEVQPILQKIRALIHEAAPDAAEKISYGMPAYTLNGGLLSFAAWKNHIAIYPRTAGMTRLPELAELGGTKGSIHFPLNAPVPFELLRKIVSIRMEELRDKQKIRDK